MFTLFHQTGTFSGWYFHAFLKAQVENEALAESRSTVQKAGVGTEEKNQLSVLVGLRYWNKVP